MAVFSSIRRALVVSFVLIALLPLAGVDLVLIYLHHRDLKADIEQKNMQLARTVGAAVGDYLEKPLSMLKHIGQVARRLAHGSDDLLDGVLDSELAEGLYFESVLILDKGGRVLHAGYIPPYTDRRGDVLGIDLSQSDFFRDAVAKGGTVWSESYISPLSGEPTIAIAIPWDRGVILGNLSLRSIGRFIDQTKVGSSTYVFIVNRQGRVLAHPDRNLVMQQESMGNLPIIRAGLAGKSGTYTYEYRGETMLGSVLRLPETGWLVVAAHNTADAFVMLRQMENLFYAGLLLAFVLAIVLALRSVGRITAPLAQLVGASKQLAGGDYGSPPLAPPFRELRELADNFQRMARAVHDREMDLKERNEELAATEEELRQQMDEYLRSQDEFLAEKNKLEAIISCMGDGLSIQDREMRIVYQNPCMKELFGDAVGRFCYDIYGHTERTHDGCCPVAAAIADGRNHRAERRVMIGGREHCFEITASPLRDATGHIAGGIELVRDVTERKNADGEIAARNTELQTLHRISRIMLASGDLDEACQAIAEEIREATAFPVVAIDIFDETRQVMQFKGVAGLGWGNGAPEAPVGETLSGMVIASGVPIIESDVRQRPEYAGSQLPELGVHSFICLPMLANHGIIGTLSLASTRSITLDDRFVQWTKSLANYIALLMERGRAEEEARLLNRELELRVQERTSQLELTNHELESFSYSVSHDLRAPLRHINGFSRILVEEHSAELGSDGRKYLERIGTACQRMGQLIDDLLELSRVSRSEIRREKVDLSRMVESITRELQEAAPQRAARFSIDERIVVDGDYRLLLSVMQNLLGNAWKYTSQTAVADIRFGMQYQEKRPVYFVKDNGAGFDMRYADKLFAPFQRLHGSEFEGTGVGLATVQRIIHRHGGRVWADAAVNQGATFYFSLSAGPAL